MPLATYTSGGEKKTSLIYIFFHVVMGPWRSNTKILLSIRAVVAKLPQPFKMPSIHQDGAICWRERAVPGEQVFLLLGGLEVETSKPFSCGQEEPSVGNNFESLPVWAGYEAAS